MLYKYDIVNAIGRAYGFTRYLEICTPTTGVRFSFVDASVFKMRHRLMYLCPDTFDDGEDITFRTNSNRSQDLIRTIDRLQADEDRYDVIFIDSFHTYGASIRDLHGALCLLRNGGVLVVHDCSPVDPAMVAAEYRDGGWCGVTYQAFIDFVLTLQQASYCVVDTDYGCGVIFTEGAVSPVISARPSNGLVFEWVLARDGLETRFAFFERHRQALLNLITPEAFLAALQRVGSATPLLEYHPRSALGPDPSLHVRVAGIEVPLASYDCGWHRYLLLAGATEAYLVSPVFTPSQHDPVSSDHRPLGLAVAALRVGRHGRARPLRLSDPSLAEGWHTEEAPTGYPWRWTNGLAKLVLPAHTEFLDVFLHRYEAPGGAEYGAYVATSSSNPGSASSAAMMM